MNGFIKSLKEVAKMKDNNSLYIAEMLVEQRKQAGKLQEELSSRYPLYSVFKKGNPSWVRKKSGKAFICNFERDSIYWISALSPLSNSRIETIISHLDSMSSENRHHCPKHRCDIASKIKVP